MMKDLNIEQIIKDAFPGKKIVIIVGDSSGDDLRFLNFNCGATDRIGLIESARIISRVQYSRYIRDPSSPKKESEKEGKVK